MNQKFANLARGMLAQNIDTTDTQFFVKNAVEIPSLSAGEFFIATVFTIGSDYGTNIEIVKVVQVAGNLWTVERGQEDTTAKEHPQNSRIELRLTAGALSNIYNDIDTKVDKVVGQGLSDSNYTQAEKDKLAGLESSHFKGQYASLEALQEAFPLASAGDYANVDEGVGHDVIRYVWDTSDSTWLPQLGASAQLTASQIKEEYESNPDTKVFSNDEKIKLEGIAAEATKNRADSANADKVHTHTMTQVTGLDTALADKASKTELNAGLALKVDKVVGKGLSDTNFTQAEKDKLASLGNNPDNNTFTQAEKTKLAGVATGATANRADTLNADKTHTHTTAQVTGLDAALLTKFDKTSVVQSTGQSTVQVMSQKAVTDVIAYIPSVPKTAAYTVVAADKGKSIDTTSNVTIRASVFTVGDVLVVTNTSATDSSILAASGVTIRLAGSTKTGTLTLAGYGVATLRMVSRNIWFASGAGLK